MKIIIMYGEMGSGKSYLGERYAKQQGMAFLEGDDFLPPAMASRIAQFKPVTPDMIKRYLLEYLIPVILGEVDARGLVVSQALYLREHRKMLVERLRFHGHEVELQHVRAPFWRHMRQLWNRPQGARWVLYGLLNKPFFQA